jgi:hypothetical protein
VSNRWKRVTALILPIVLMTAGFAPRPTDSIDRALVWLRGQQQADGGFSNGFTPGSDPGTTSDAVLAIVAAGDDPAAWSGPGASPLEFLNQAVGVGDVAGPGAAAKVALAMLAAGADPRSVAGHDLADEITQGFDPATGFFGMGPYDSALAILALTGMQQPLPAGAIDGLIGARLPDGSYAFNGDRTPGAGDSNTTAIVVQALVAAGNTDEAAASLPYFQAARNDDGGWTYQKPSAFGEATDANSTALVLQALYALGESPDDWREARAVLESLQVPSGGFIFNAATSGENLLATVQAIPALAGWDYIDASDPAHATIAGGATPAAALPLPGEFAWATAGLLIGVLVVAALAAPRR